MNSKSHLVAIILVTLRLLCPQLNAASRYAEGELLVKWHDGPESYAAAVGNAVIGSTVKRSFNAIGWQLVKLPPDMSVVDGIQAYKVLGTVLSVEPNSIMQPICLPQEGLREPARGLHPISSDDLPDGDTIAASDSSAQIAPRAPGLHSLTASSAGVIPNDPRFGDQWYLRKIGATNAWATTTGITNIVVAVLDTGVDYNHPDLKANMWRNPGETGLDANGNDKATNGIDDDGNGYVDDVYGIDAVNGTGDPMDTGYYFPPAAPFYHGTYCAGIIGAAGNNGVGMVGVNWSVQIMAIRWYGDLSQNAYETVLSHVLAAWDYVVMMKRKGVNIRVTNNSTFSNDWSHALRDAIAAAGNEGILNVCIAGNQPVDQDLYPISFPGDYNERSILNVAASTESDTLTSFSGFGRGTVDLAAPGINMLSTVKGGGYIGGGSGTSFACPQVAGAAALLWAKKPELTVDEIKAALLGSVDQFSAMKGKLITGGRLNVARAIDYLTNADPPAMVIYAAPAGQRTLVDDPIEVTFNRAMDHVSVEAAFVIQPFIDGVFEWRTERSFVYSHGRPFYRGTNYTVRILGTARDIAGNTLDGNFNRLREDSPADDYLWTFRFPIANDDFADAQTLAGSSGSATANALYGSWEPGEWDLLFGSISTGSTLWYRWTPPESGGWFMFDLTGGTAFDSVLAVMTGDRIDRITEVAWNDNYGAKPSSRVSFPALPGTNYSILVASKAASVADLVDPAKVGKFKLDWYPTPPPGFTGTEFSPAGGAPGAKVALTGTNFTGATSVLFNGAAASFTNALTNNLDLRITAIVPSDATSGPITVMSPHGNVTSTSPFQVLPPPLSVSFNSISGLQISWPATSTALVLEVSEDLRSASWTPVPQAAVMANGISTLTLAAPAENRFYRLRTE